MSFGATSVQLKRGKNRAFSRKRHQGHGLEFLPSWFVANGVKMLNALFGVAYELEAIFFSQLAAPNVAPKTN